MSVSTVARATLATALCLAASQGCHRRRHRRSARAAVSARVTPLADSRHAPHADGRAGDLVIETDRDLRVTVAAQPDVEGHRPMRGAVVDVARGEGDVSDPLLWWRPVWVGRGAVAHPFVAERVSAHRCARGAAGVRAEGSTDGVRFTVDVCATRGGVETRVQTEGLPPDAALFDELNPGSATVLIDGQGEGWEGTFPTRSVVLAERGLALRFASESPAPATRQRVHIAGETFPAAVRWQAAGAGYTHTVTVLRGDALDALALDLPAREARVFDVVAPESTLPATLTLLDAHGDPLFAGEMREARRRVTLPAGYGAGLRFTDARGVPMSAWVLSERTPAAEVLRATAPSTGRVTFAITEGEPARPLPVHALFRGVEGTADPTPRLIDGAGHSAGRSVYLTAGRGAVALAPGRYRVTVTRGPGYTIQSGEFTVAAGDDTLVEATLTRVAPEGYTAADLHLHMAPSPDSRVSLAERAASLACNGVAFAAATDHNRVTDLAPAVHEAGLDPWLTVVPGVEVTSAGTDLWGHFNAFPMAAPDADAAPEEVTPPYYALAPREIFEGVRASGADILQVNHARMAPRIGYFDLARFDAATGEAGERFVDGFEALEVFNGLWLESPARVREGLTDLIGLGRRGQRVTATGNSDSHRLLYEEAGWPVTWVHTPTEPRATLAARVVEALRSGAATVGSGPFVEITVNDVSPGAVLTAPRRTHGVILRAHVRVTAPAWVPVERVEVWRDDEVVHVVRVTGEPRDGVRWEGDLAVPVYHDAAIGAWAEATTPLPDVLPLRDARAVGFTNPVWVDFDGDGVVRLPRRGEAVPR
ncbi:MAG: CehA/McbA family metallohydrolase [Polyangiales bacterium]